MLNAETVLEIRRRYQRDEWSIDQLKDTYRVSFATISRIINGRTWKDVTGGTNISRAGQDTDLRCAVIQARLDQGVTNHRILAEELGISRQAVRKLIITRGMTLTPKKNQGGH